MNSNSLFIKGTSAVFAFAIISVLVMGSPIKDKADDNDFLSPYSDFEIKDSCEFSAHWDDPLEKEISFIYYTKQNPKGKIFDLELQPVPDFSFTTETKILTHGFRGSVNAPEFRTVITAYLKRNESLNVLALDWTSYSSQKYREAAKATVVVGKAISCLFFILYKYYDIYPQQMHFIGYGLGAHLFAATARESKMKVGRITGLNPSRPCFEEQCKNLLYPQLSRNDAELVDILHTDIKKYGIRNPQGTVDFYANKGKNQPMCHAPYGAKPVPANCESLSAYLYFAESILIPNAFYGIHCETIHPTLNCNKNLGMYWGEYMDIIRAGTYNFNTRGRSPFGKGRSNFSDELNCEP